MRIRPLMIVATCALGAPFVLGCKKDVGAPPAGTPSGGAEPQPSSKPAEPPVPQPAGSGAPGEMAVPGPAALSCTSDAMCFGHKCNAKYGKCAFPCESDNDCTSGARCYKSALSTCLTKPPGQ